MMKELTGREYQDARNIARREYHAALAAYRDALARLKTAKAAMTVLHEAKKAAAEQGSIRTYYVPQDVHPNE